MPGWVLVCLGGALGAGVRYALTGWVALSSGAQFPFGTLAVNVLGCFLIGALLGSPWGAESAAPGPRLFFATGVLGGFTTYSAFSWETIALARDGQLRAVAWNVLANALGSLAACAAGLWIVQRLVPGTGAR